MSLPRSIVWITLFLIATTASPARARDLEPLPMFNQNPLVQIFGLPAIGSARVLANGEQTAGVSDEAANYFIYQQTDNEQLTLDGETHRINIAFHRGNQHGEWGVELPYLTHGGGWMDSFILHW